MGEKARGGILVTPYQAIFSAHYYSPVVLPRRQWLHILFNAQNPGQWDRLLNGEIQESATVDVTAECGAFAKMVDSANELRAEFYHGNHGINKMECLTKRGVLGEVKVQP